jgi:hypothetical protein
MHEIISARGVTWLGWCLGCGFLLLATHLGMKIRMVIQALPGAWLLTPKEDRLTILKYRDEARSREWGLWPVYLYEVIAGAMLFTALMVIVNEALLKTPHYPEAQVQQVFLRWKASRKGKTVLTASPEQAINDIAKDDAAKKDAKEADAKKDAKEADAKQPPAPPKHGQ